MQGIANLQYIVFVAMVEINRSYNFISPFDHNAVASWEIVLLIAFKKDMLQIVNFIFQGLDGWKACWVRNLWQTSVDMNILSISYCTDS
ncbi:Uncharacterised protein [Mycobacteroides abscessus subsp. abscessus]|nr:Uncharacterised protein [Mycobacteroides abscessus subsp. abscessus]